jgi:hypothetical protein
MRVVRRCQNGQTKGIFLCLEQGDISETDYHFMLAVLNAIEKIEEIENNPYLEPRL